MSLGSVQHQRLQLARVVCVDQTHAHVNIVGAISGKITVGGASLQSAATDSKMHAKQTDIERVARATNQKTNS